MFKFILLIIVVIAVLMYFDVDLQPIVDKIRLMFRS